MHDVIKYEFEEFKKEYEKDTLTFERYLDESEYEDEYSHNKIDKAQVRLIEMIRDYLHEKAPGRYVVTSGWCVFVMTIEEAQRRNLLHLEDCIVY